MSGSGGGGGSDDFRPTATPVAKKGAGGGGRSGSLPDVCNINEDIALSSPNPAVISTLKKGDTLAVRLIPGPPRRLEVVKGTDVAGSITSPNLLQLIECILAEWAYIAIVLDVSGGRCIVRVRPQ